MSAHAIQEAFGRVRVLPQPPGFDIRAVSTMPSGSAAVLHKLVAEHERGMSVWRSRMLEIETKVRALLEQAAAEPDPQVLISVRDDALGDMIEDASGFIREVEDRNRLSTETKDRLFEAAGSAPELHDLVLSIEAKYEHALTEAHSATVELYYRLKALQADFDPSSKGGPRFENAGDLIAFLDS